MKSPLRPPVLRIDYYALSLLGESYFMGLEPEKERAVVAEAFEGIETSGQHMHEAELWRLHGELLVLGGRAEAETERSFVVGYKWRRPAGPFIGTSRRHQSRAASSHSQPAGGSAVTSGTDCGELH
jgi:hypothetical protein